jgi:hypothetical protein
MRLGKKARHFLVKTSKRQDPATRAFELYRSGVGIQPKQVSLDKI